MGWILDFFHLDFVDLQTAELRPFDQYYIFFVKPKFNLQKLGDKLLKALNFLTKDFDQGNNSIILNGKNIEDFSNIL
jgi:hypothetical protein